MILHTTTALAVIKDILNLIEALTNFLLCDKRRTTWAKRQGGVRMWYLARWRGPMEGSIRDVEGRKERSEYNTRFRQWVEWDVFQRGRRRQR
jgi:hypothetical protein